jgi:hypothetical protein
MLQVIKEILIKRNISPVQMVPVFENALPGRPANERHIPKNA